MHARYYAGSNYSWYNYSNPTRYDYSPTRYDSGDTDKTLAGTTNAIARC